LSNNEINFKCSDNEDVCDLARSNNDFGFDIFKALHKKHLNENLFISPLSISTALSMTLNGAMGDTYNEMKKTLKYNGWDLDELNRAYKAYLDIVPNLDNDVKMSIANSIWYSQNYDILPSFLDVNRKYFESEIFSTDFSKSKTKNEINGWVEDKTEGKIKDVLDNVSADMVMLLINAIYFKGNWMYEFDKKNTTKMGFTKEDGSTINVDMMNLAEITVPYYRNDLFSMIDLPYGDSIYSMCIMVPNNGNKVDDIIKDLDISTWNDYINGLSSDKVTVSIPKFKIEFKDSLKNILIDLGMVKAFGNADFSKIVKSRDIFIDEVIHQSFVEVDEKGTEAAAVTVVVIKYNAVNNSFIANKPFVFVIRDNKTNSILFIGKVMDIK
jgi:serpin B